MAVHFDFPRCLGQLPFRVYEEGAAFNALILFPVQTFQFPDAIALRDFVLFVTQKQYTKLMLFSEFLMTRRRIRAYPDDYCVLLLKVGQLFGKLYRLSCTATCVIFRVEVQNNPFARKVGYTFLLACAIGQTEQRCASEPISILSPQNHCSLCCKPCFT